LGRLVSIEERLDADFSIAGVADGSFSRQQWSARRLRSRQDMPHFTVDRPDQTRVPHRHSGQRLPSRLTVVALAALLFVAPGRGAEAVSSAGGGAFGGFGAGRGGGARGAFNGGRMGGGSAGHERFGEGHGRGAGGDFRGYHIEHRRFHHFDDDLVLFIYPYSPDYDYEPYEPGDSYDPYCNEYSPSYDARYCDVSP
jgi:hypothetical protein